MDTLQEPLSDKLPQFIQHLEDKGRSPSTVLAYRSDVEQLISYLEKNNTALAKDVRHDHVEGFRDWLLANGYTAKSASRKLNAVKTFFRWMLAGGHAPHDPTTKVSHPEIEPSLPQFLSELEYRALRDVVKSDQRTATIVELVLQTGMRISEIAEVEIDHIKEDHIYIAPHATQPERQIPLNAIAKESLEKWLEERPGADAPHVFVSKNGKKLAIRNIRAAIDRFMERAGIPKYSVNDLRTTFIVHNLKKGADPAHLSVIVGHKRPTTTERYLLLAEMDEAGSKKELAVL